MNEISTVGKWVSREDLAHVQFNRMDHLEVIYAYFAERESDKQPRYRQPWESRGWITGVMSWVKEVLAALTIEVVGQPEPMKWWCLSCVLRVSTTQGNVYFKVNAAQPLFVDEGIFLRYMGKRYPGRIPTVLGTEPSNGWMLVGDAGERLRYNMPTESKEELLRTFAAIQLDSINFVDELLALGCADRRAHRHIPLISPLLDDELMISKLTVEEISELRNQVPALMEMHSKLTEFAVPSTLIHGDLNLGNVTTVNDKLNFIDWTDASVAHPFMDMFLIFDESDLTLRDQLRDVYLEQWTHFEPMDRLQELWSLCEVVHAIHHAISYQSILHHTEERSRYELGDAPSFYLRKALHFLQEHGY
ncbi:aminoglycoside phosphotransferase family protein [Paenibacillus qinlingensis]|uniref:Aminoglycoside phosphotransferase domain-containing protein n=1 Tax=Paenibacillus qinlingensis TaxID=1837343 RepID=A0ABU1NS90_9BACL|nr:aminoglycoside phosphotransferase family protein [Paenibacillus qinlingensis]MDR6550189.1 hypothetical protein [Paenibacillus qinlingensis]